MTNRSLLFTAALFLAAASGGWNVHGVPPPPNYSSWREALADIPCNKIIRDGDYLQVIELVIVDGKEHPTHVVTSKDEIKAVEDRCPLLKG
jgi:hypothetical protein